MLNLHIKQPIQHHNLIFTLRGMLQNDKLSQITKWHVSEFVVQYSRKNCHFLFFSIFQELQLQKNIYGNQLHKLIFPVNKNFWHMYVKVHFNRFRAKSDNFLHSFDNWMHFCLIFTNMIYMIRRPLNLLRHIYISFGGDND